jgi:hypothetical protein
VPRADHREGAVGVLGAVCDGLGGATRGRGCVYVDGIRATRGDRHRRDDGAAAFRVLFLLLLLRPSAAAGAGQHEQDGGRGEEGYEATRAHYVRWGGREKERRRRRRKKVAKVIFFLRSSSFVFDPDFEIKRQLSLFPSSTSSSFRDFFFLLTPARKRERKAMNVQNTMLLR